MRSSAQLLLFVIAIFFRVPLHSQTAVAKLEAAIPNTSGRDILEDRQQWQEIEKERSIFSSSFLTPDHRTIIHYSKEPLNYLKEGTLVPVNYTPSLRNNELVAEEQPSPVIVSSAGAIITGKNERNRISYSGNPVINGKTCSSSAFQIAGTTAVMKDVLAGVDKIFEFHFNAVEYSYIFHHTVTSPGQDLVIEETMELPPGASLQPYDGCRVTDTGWFGSVSVLTDEKEEIGHIRGAVCFDANKNVCTAAYKAFSRNGKTVLAINVPDAWINDPSRVFPLTLDPLVTGPTSTWGGSYIPSCLAPMNHADSILVTIPAAITVTGLFVSASYYADPFSTAVMSDGQMFFSTTCSQSTTFTVAPPAGSTAGTGYLSAYDLHSPLLCCKPQSCSSQTFYLLMHLYRTAGGSGCGTTYIYHDPFSGYPFQAYIEGRTPESFGAQWNVTPNNICSNVCNLTGTVYVRYGVPPFTITHPWASGTFTAGAAAGCSFGNITKALPLTIPSCPWTCDTITMLSVPPPTVTDACGTAVLTSLATAIPPKIITIKETPVASASPNPVTACSDVPFSTSLSSCIAGSTFNWSGPSNGTSAFITDTISNSGSTVSATTYSVTATSNGCTSDTLLVTVNTDPSPAAGFTESVPVIINVPAGFSDNTLAVGGSVNSWFWDFGDGSGSILQNPVHTYAIPGIYTVCLATGTTDGCTDTICKDINVIPAELVLPNVITPNGDNQNDYLYFKYLEFFGSNELKVYDRWGKIIFQKSNYSNDWDAKNCSDGTYFFVLETADKHYPGYVQIIHQ